MDKSLKKLSRVELLELMVSLSEDYEELADENNRLKKMLSSQRLPRSTKVGSIAEAALQANGYFEAAQRSADEYLREIKHLRDELAKRIEEQSQSALSKRAQAIQQAEYQAQLELQHAQAHAKQIVAHANAQAEAILADARSRANDVLADANRRSHAILSQSQRQAEMVVPTGSRMHGSTARRSIQSVPSPMQAGSRVSASSGDFAVDYQGARSRSGRTVAEGGL